MSDGRFYNLVFQFAGTWNLVYAYPDIFRSVYNVSLDMELVGHNYDALAYGAFFRRVNFYFDNYLSSVEATSYTGIDKSAICFGYIP